MLVRGNDVCCHIPVQLAGELRHGYVFHTVLSLAAAFLPRQEGTGNSVLFIRMSGNSEPLLRADSVFRAVPVDSDGIKHRMFWATVLGLVMPYWFAVGYYVVTNQFDAFIDHFAELAQFEPLLQYEALDIHRIATFGLVVLLAVIGIIHYMRNSYQDKIRTRMIFEMFITVDILSFVYIILQPQHFDNLLPIIIVNTSCLFAHYVALTRTWLTNVTFIVMCLATLGLTIFNLMP